MVLPKWKVEPHAVKMRPLVGEMKMAIVVAGRPIIESKTSAVKKDSAAKKENAAKKESPVSIVEGNAIAETADAERATSGKKMVVGGDPAVVDEKNIAATTTIANAERRVEMGMVVEMTTITRRASGKEKEARAAPDVLGPTSRQTNIERIVIDQKAWKVEMDSWSGIDSSSRTLTRFKMRDPVETFSDF